MAIKQKSFAITVDYAKSLNDMIAAGNYSRGYLDESITTENFPIQGKGTVNTEVVLVRFGRGIYGTEVAGEMGRMGLEPAKIEHLLAFAAQHWQGKPKSIVALGSCWDDPYGRWLVPCLLGWDGWWGGWRRLCLDDLDICWPGRYRFLALHKSHHETTGLPLTPPTTTTAPSPLDTWKAEELSFTASEQRSFPIIVDYRRSLPEMVKAAGFSFIDPDITPDHFPLAGTGAILTELVLVRFDGAVTSDAVIKQLDQMGLVPAKIEHLLAFFALDTPHLPTRRPILCLGSVWTSFFGIGRRRVPCVRVRDGLELYTTTWEGEWAPGHRFAAVRK